MTFDELFQSAVDKPQTQRVTDARENLATVLNYMTTLQDKGYGAVATVALMCTFVAADGKVSAGEFDFIQELLEGNIDYQVLCDSAQAAIDTNQMAEMDGIMDKAPKDIKKAFLCLCLDFIACDGNITRNEVELFKKYAQ